MFKFNERFRFHNASGSNSSVLGKLGYMGAIIILSLQAQTSDLSFNKPVRINRRTIMIL